MAAENCGSGAAAGGAGVPLARLAIVIVAAAALYSYHLGAESLGASEAYSAWASSKPGIAAIVRIPILEDPGKQVFYYIVLHYWCLIFGTSEAALRSLSVSFSIAALVMIFAAGRQLFDDEVAAAGITMWAFNPLAYIFAHRARMYPMIITFAFAHLYLFLRVRERPSVLRIAGCALAGAAMVYTHTGTVPILAAEGVILAHDFIRGRREFGSWLALGLAGLLYVPYLPIAMGQSRVLLVGHSLDYLGTGGEYSTHAKVIAGAIGTVALLWMVFRKQARDEYWERIGFCATWAIVPILAFVVGSIIIRPVFQIRYVSPSIAMLAVAAAAFFSLAGAKVRNLATAGVTLAMVAITMATRTIDQPWGAIARMVMDAGSSTQPVIFESGFVSRGPAAREPNGGFPLGYYSVPFDYYFGGENPHIVVPGYDPDAARGIIQSAVERAGGGWLISWKSEDDARAELPSGPALQSTLRLSGEDLRVYRIVPSPIPALSR